MWKETWGGRTSVCKQHGEVWVRQAPEMGLNPGEHFMRSRIFAWSPHRLLISYTVENNNHTVEKLDNSLSNQN